ncbi:hypothetical protein VTN77DRAFT_9149 [Rasamsonia byssochlamydoides]|uniref:uncharacterized protein n=1 Tax=Rasamsonia byssochlamydoides TaxID=89139 RepID=UPI0037430B03
MRNSTSRQPSKSSVVAEEMMTTMGGQNRVTCRGGEGDLPASPPHSCQNPGPLGQAYKRSLSPFLIHPQPPLSFAGGPGFETRPGRK